MTSLRARLLLVASVLLAAGLGVVGALVGASVRAALDQAQRERLDSQIITLLAVAEPGAARNLQFPIDMPEERLNRPDSGLYAKVRDRSGEFLWRSHSALGVSFEPDTPLPSPGQQVFAAQRTGDGVELLTLTLGVVWEFAPGDERYFALSVAEDRAVVLRQAQRFRGRMVLAFVVLAALLVIAMAFLLSWLLRPLGQVAREIRAVETGERDGLSQRYPDELSGVARSLNALLDSEQRRIERYRQTLANLAHSLKTPLAAARTLLREGADREALERQLTRMDDIVRYQLSRPAAAGGRMVGRGSVPVLPEVQSLLNGLDKVYRDKGVRAELEIAPDVDFPGDRGDLVELLGNVLDNAYKWARQRVLISAAAVPPGPAGRSGVRLEIEDDGPGMPVDQIEAALTRGTRLDESVAGSGIGLAVVADLMAAYGGSVRIDTGRLGGARVMLDLPAS